MLQSCGTPTRDGASHTDVADEYKYDNEHRSAALRRDERHLHCNTGWRSPGPVHRHIHYQGLQGYLLRRVARHFRPPITAVLGFCTAVTAARFLLIGAGIYRSRLDLTSGSLVAAELVAEALQPSWLRWHPTRHDILYCANEDRDAPTCSAYQIRAGGSLQLLNAVSTGAAGPTHFSVSPDGRFLAVANYGGGALTVIPTADDGSLRPASATMVHEGNGPNPKRQKEPHAQSANFSACGRFIFCCDLGTDQVVIYELRADGTVERRYEPATPNCPHLLSSGMFRCSLTCSCCRGAGSTAPGGGPRHLAVHPSLPVVYMNTEMLPCGIDVYDWNVSDTTLNPRQTVPTLPTGYDGSNGTSELLLNSSATKLYCANRG